MPARQEQRELEKYHCEESIGLRRSKRNKYHLDVAAVIKSGGCSPSVLNYSSPIKRKWASNRPERQTSSSQSVEEAIQHQKVSPRQNTRRKQETLQEEHEKGKIDKEYERQEGVNKDNTEEIQDYQVSTTFKYAGESTSEQKVNGLRHAVENESLLAEKLIEEEKLIPTETITTKSQSFHLSDLSTSQPSCDFKRIRKVPLRHRDYCSEGEDESEEYDDDVFFRSFKVEYMLTNEIKTVEGFSCTRCPAVFESRVGLTNHLKLHGSKKVLPCEICDFSCTNKKTLRQHRRVHGLTRRLRVNPALVRNINTTSESSQNGQQVPISDSGTPKINLIPITSNSISNRFTLLKKELSPHYYNGINKTIKMEEARGEDSCEEPIIVISSLDEISVIGSEDHLHNTVRQQYDDSGCGAGGSSGDDVMPILEQIIPSPAPLRITNEENLTMNDLEINILKEDKNILFIHEQNRKREEEKMGKKRRLLNSYANLSAIANLKHLDEHSFYTKKGTSLKLYDRNTVHCPKCPFRTQSKLRLAPHMAGHERSSGFVCSVCQFKNESSGLLRRHCQMHESDGVVCKWPPDYVGAPSVSKGNNKHGSKQKEKNITGYTSFENRDLTINDKKRTNEIVHFSTINAPSGDDALNPVLKRDLRMNFSRFCSVSESYISSKKLCNFSCRWCSFLFWSGPAGLLLHKLRRHARMDKQRSTLYKELLLERLAWKPSKQAIENNIEMTVQSGTPNVYISNNVNLDSKMIRKFPFRCHHCPYNTDQIFRLHKHENKHFFKAEHNCQKCSYSCRSMHILMQHSRLHEELNSFSTKSNVISSSHNSQNALPNTSQEVVQQHPSNTTLSTKRGFFRHRETNFCPHCPYKSKHNCDMKAHLKMHIERRKFACRHCTYSTMRQNALLSHEKLHQVNITHKGACRQVKWIYAREDGKRSAHLGWRLRILRSGWHFYRCSIIECGAEFAFCNELVQHSRHHHLAWWRKKKEIVTTKNLIRCTICDFRTALDLRMRDHEAIHQGEECKNVRSVGGVFNCRDCPYSTANYAKFWNHRQKHKRTNRFTCSLCSFSSGSIQCYIEHSKLHGNIQQLPNNESSEDFNKTSKTIKMEVMEINGNKSEALSNNSNKLTSSLISSSDISMHDLRSGELPTFRKHKFQEQFGAISPVIAQLKLASGPTKNAYLDTYSSSNSTTFKKTITRSCTECPYKTNDNVLIKLHLQMHKGGGIRPYSCNLCSFRCFSAESLHSHLFLHSQVTFTSKNFGKNDDNLNQPQKSNSFYQCSQCNFKCVDINSFLQHRKEHVQLFQQRLLTIIKRSSNDNDLVKENKTRFPRSRSDKQHFCSRCSFRCDSLQAFSLHMEHHKMDNECQPGVFRCSTCDYSSNTKNVVIFHEKNHHLDVPLTSLCHKIMLQQEEKNN